MLAQWTCSENIYRMLRNMESVFFCLREYLFTNILWIKTENISTFHAFHMFMMMSFTALDFILFMIFSEINSSENSYITKEFYISKNTGSSHIRKYFYELLTFKKMHFFHLLEKLKSLRSHFFPILFQNSFNFHKWD